MLPGEPGGGRTPEGVGPRANDTLRRAGAEIGGASSLSTRVEPSPLDRRSMYF